MKSLGTTGDRGDRGCENEDVDRLWCTEAVVEIMLVGRETRYRELTCSSAIESRFDSSNPPSASPSSFFFAPPSCSITPRIAFSHPSISSALLNTRRTLVVLRLPPPTADPPRNLDKIERDLFICAPPPTSGCTCCTTCTTQCLPGIRSHAKAADFSPSCNTLSGIRS